MAALRYVYGNRNTHMVPTPEINRRLDEIESREEVTIIYACESGSRAWGFPSRDSDYDVRFIYVRPTEWYLRILEDRDVIERPIVDEIDINGWDLRKALRLFRKSNPPLLEWLQSPIVYRDKPELSRKLRALVPVFYSPKASMYHYLHMAEGNYRDYLKGEQVRTKKYLYALRPVLACRWIESGLGAVPMEFGRLCGKVLDDTHLRGEIDSLVERKRAGEELGSGPRNAAIDEFLRREIARLKDVAGTVDVNQSETSRLDRFFTEALVAVNGSWPPTAKSKG